MLGTATVANVFSVNGGPPFPGELRVEQEIEFVRSRDATKPDPSWAHYDAKRHFHAFDKDGKLPTLVATSVPMPCDGSCGGVCGGEGYHVTRYTCRACDQEIRPRFIPDVEARTTGTPVPLMKEWSLVLRGGRDLAQLPQGRVSVRDGEGSFGFGWAGDWNMTTDVTGETTVEVTIHGDGPWSQRPTAP